MTNMRHLRSREYLPFSFMLAVSIGLLALAFVMDKPGAVFDGFMRILQSRSILVTDYVALGGIGGALLNVSLVGILTTLLLIFLGVIPSGPNIMALWMSVGFAFFGKNVFNMVPLTCGVWLFAKYTKRPFSSLHMSALLVATISPIISEIAFLGIYNRTVEITAGVLVGFLIGFIFPAVAADSVKVHSGFNLYNMGFTGGLIATIITTLLRGIGLEIVPANYWSEGNNAFFAGLLYSLSVLMFAVGLLSGFAKEHPKKNIKQNLDRFRKIHEHSGRLTDYYEMFQYSIYMNMAVLCAFGTTVVLILGADLNGATLAGILTMTGFGSTAKHLRNVFPVVVGAVASAFVNKADPTAPGNILAILFSSGLAPIAGMFGPVWGIIAGFVHVNVAAFVGALNGGLNLYNNGFAASFTVMFLLPIITIIKRDSYFKKEKYR